MPDLRLRRSFRRTDEYLTTARSSGAPWSMKMGITLPVRCGAMLPWSSPSYLTRWLAYSVHDSTGRARVPLFRFNVFEPDPASCAQAISCLLDTTQEARVMFEPVFEPVFF